MITLEHLCIGYGGQAVAPAVHGQLRPATLTAVIGDNGCGKSTLLKTLVGLLPPVSGRVVWQTPVRPRIAWLPQINDLDREFPLRVQDVVSMGCWPHRSLFASLRGQQARVDQALARVGLEAMRREPIESLSGGQFQRMLFARLLVQDASLILLDEPFTGVDEETSQLLMDLICAMHQQGKTVIAVLHDQARVRRHFPEVLRIRAGCVDWGETVQICAPAAVPRERKVA